jgi:small subunit ribosomal protein S4
MSRYRGPKDRLSRRFETNLFGAKRNPMDRKGFAPGQHGQNRRAKKSEYGIHLDAKQKFRAYYGMISEAQFRKTFEKARRMRAGVTGEVFVGLLESRLDVMALRMNFAPNIWAARQVVTHGHITVNGKRCNIPSARVMPGDVVGVREKSRKIPMIFHQFLGSKGTPPSYVEVNQDEFCGKLLHFPEKHEVPFPGEFNEQLLVEFYSR